MTKFKMLTIAMVEETGEIISMSCDVSPDDEVFDENPFEEITSVYGPCIPAAYFIDESFTEEDAYDAFSKFLNSILVA